MRSNTTDIRKELENMIVQTQDEIGSMQEEKGKIEEKLQEAESALSSLRQVYELQAKRFGETRARFWGREGEGKPYRFAGMRLIDALALIRKVHPRIDKREARRVLEKEGFDFRGKRPLTAVHFAWIALDRKEKRKVK